MGQRIQGTEDLYGGYMRSWEHMQDIARHLFGTYGFDRIETPALEQVDTFVHGIGESTDVVRKEMFRVFSGALLDDLLAAGVKIYNFNKGLLHTKSMLIDNRLALVGTVNMDMRSFLLNFEVTMVVEDPAFANEISLLHESYIKNAELVDYVTWSTRSVYQRIIEKLFFLFSPLL